VPSLKAATVEGGSHGDRQGQSSCRDAGMWLPWLFGRTAGPVAAARSVLGSELETGLMGHAPLVCVCLRGVPP
jgi:hypothetical protein